MLAWSSNQHADAIDRHLGPSVNFDGVMQDVVVNTEGPDVYSFYFYLINRRQLM